MIPLPFRLDCTHSQNSLYPPNKQSNYFLIRLFFKSLLAQYLDSLYFMWMFNILRHLEGGLTPQNVVAFLEYALSLMYKYIPCSQRLLDFLLMKTVSEFRFFHELYRFVRLLCIFSCFNTYPLQLRYTLPLMHQIQMTRPKTLR